VPVKGKDDAKRVQLDEYLLELTEFFYQQAQGSPTSGGQGESGKKSSDDEWDDDSESGDDYDDEWDD
jgi:hypothetical protein